MTPVPPDVIPEGRYNASQTAAVLGISRHTLARWVKAGLIKQRFSRATSLPRYAGKDILTLWRSEF